MMEPKNNGGEFICDKCNGTGWDPEQPQELEAVGKACTKCDGDGVVDWVENAVGKKEDDILKRISIDPLGDIGCH